MSELKIYAGVIVAATKTDPAPADAAMSYSVEAYINGGRIVISGVSPPAYARPDPAAIDAQPMVVGEKVLLIGQYQAGRFDGVLSRIEGERMAFADCGGV